MSNYLTQTTVGDILSHFEEIMREEHYKKMPYQNWQLLNKNRFEVVTITRSPNDISLFNVYFNGYLLTFGEYDYSFGEFLSDYYQHIIINDSLKEISSVKVTCDYDGSAFSNAISDTSGIVYSFKNNSYIKKEEVNEMKGFNFDFGTCEKDNVRMSPYGIAVKNNSGNYVSYNVTDGSVVDVDVFNFNGGKYLFKMPVAIKDIAVGDVIIHNRVPMFVVDTKEGVTAIDVAAGEKKTILPVRNMFGFDFCTKVVSLFNACDNAPTTDAPFGNMLPFLMLENGGVDNDAMLAFMMMQGQTGFANNPMMMYFLMKDRDGDNLLPLLFMMNQNK